MSSWRSPLAHQRSHSSIEFRLDPPTFGWRESGMYSLQLRVCGVNLPDASIACEQRSVSRPRLCGPHSTASRIFVFMCSTLRYTIVNLSPLLAAISPPPKDALELQPARTSSSNCITKLVHLDVDMLSFKLRFRRSTFHARRSTLVRVLHPLGASPRSLLHNRAIRLSLHAATKDNQSPHVHCTNLPY